MLETLLLPDLGEGIEAGSIITISIAPGEAVVVGQPLFEIEADKVSVEVPSTVDGVVLELFVIPGDTVPIGGRLAALEVSAVTAPANEPTERWEERREATLQTGSAAPVPASEGQRLSHGYHRLPMGGHPAPAGPAARRMARELGVDIHAVPGSGQRGRISRQDVIRHAGKLLKAEGKKPHGQFAGASQLPDLSRFGLVEHEPLSNIQRATARNLARAWREIPHAWMQARIDITRLERQRALIKAEKGAATGLSISPFVVKALAMTMQAFPLFNASIDLTNDTLVYRRYIDIGVAVDTSRGLVVPVIRRVDGKQVEMIASELATLAEQARSNRLQADQLQGAGMTLSNLGGMEVGNILPVINWPQSSILGVASAHWSRRRLAGGQWEERLLLPVSMAIDHRIINGAEGARFLAHLRGLLEEPDRLPFSG